MTCPLETLHTEILVQVVSHLDNYSVLSLLQAFPELCKYAVLITDHKMPCLFFAIPGIRRMILDTSATRALFPNDDDQFFSSSKDRTPIKLVECCFERSLKDLVEMHAPLVPKTCQLKTNFDETTFVFVRDELSDGRACQQLMERLDEFTNCKFQFGAIVNFTKRGVTSLSLEEKYAECCPHGRPVPSVGPSYYRALPKQGLSGLGTLKTLQLHNISIDGLKIPFTTHLALIYTDKDSPRPLIRALNAPKLKKFIVHFNHKVPSFQKMGDVGGWKPTPIEDLKEAWGATKKKQTFISSESYTMFELVNIPSLDIHRKTKRASYHPEGDNGEMDMRFMKHFQIMNLVGIPSAVISSPGLLDHVIKLRWITHEDHKPTEFSMSSLVSLNLVLCGSHCRAPVIRTTDLKSFNVSILAPFVDISGLRPCHSALGGFDTFCIYSTPRLLHHGSIDGIYSMIYKEWCWIKMSQTTSLLSIAGVQMPILGEEGPAVVKYLKWRHCPDVTIRPAVHVADGSSVAKVNIRNVHLGPKTTISPIFSLQSTKYEKVLSFEGCPIKDSAMTAHIPLEIITSSEIDRVEVPRAEMAPGGDEPVADDSFVVYKRYKIAHPGVNWWQRPVGIRGNHWDGGVDIVNEDGDWMFGFTLQVVKAKKEVGVVMNDKQWRYKDSEWVIKQFLRD